MGPPRNKLTTTTTLEFLFKWRHVIVNRTELQTYRDNKFLQQRSTSSPISQCILLFNISTILRLSRSLWNQTYPLYLSCQQHLELIALQTDCILLPQSQ